MSASTDSLRGLLDLFETKDGVGKLVVMHMMKTYMMTHGTRRVIEEINEIISTKELDILSGAGARGPLYKALMCRGLELELLEEGL